MGTICTIDIPHTDAPGDLTGLEDECAGLMVAWEERLSRWRNGAVSTLNRNAGGAAIKPGLPVWRVLVRLQNLCNATGGMFNPLLGRIIDSWGFGPGGRTTGAAIRLKPDEMAPGNAEEWRIGNLQLDRQYYTARILHAKAVMDLGGAGKGVLLDELHKVFERRRIFQGIINLGGSSILALGHPPGEPGWRINLSPARGSTTRASICLRNCCLTTSGMGSDNNGGPENFGHIIHPHSGGPLKTETRVFVISRLALLGDVLSTAWPIMTSTARQKFLVRYPGIRVIEFAGTDPLREYPGPVPGLIFDSPVLKVSSNPSP